MAFIEKGDGKRNRKRKIYTQSKFVKGKRTCPVCGNTDDWDCSLTVDGGLAYCKFIPNQSGITDPRGRYQHILNTNSKENLQATKETMNDNSNQVIKADADRLNEVYTALLEDLILNEEHRNNLLNERCLSNIEIARNQYASVPKYSDRFTVAESLSKQFELEGVPGFYQDNGRWCLNMTFPGFYVPYRDVEGRIVGLQIRRDEDVENKYMWVSSDGKDKGTSSGSPLHFVNVDSVKDNKLLYLTEGALKADIIGSLLDVGLVASAGVCAISPEKLVHSIFEVFPDLERIGVAYDMDWETNGNVRFALIKLLVALKEKYRKVDVATWDISLGKGFDDVLINEMFTEDTVKYVPADEFQARLVSLAVAEVKEETKTKIEESADETLLTELSENEGELEDFEELEQVQATNEQDNRFDENPIMYSWGELSTMEFTDIEKVMFGLMRGNVGMFIASTNLGKTTLALNLALSATAEQEFHPLLNQNHTARKILYIDGEASKPELQADIRKMLEGFTPHQVELVKKNLFVICDEELEYEPLDLASLEHQEIIRQKALICQPDLIIVDTMSALMDIEDENDNAKVKTEVMKPLKKLAKQTNCATLLLHHTGKYNEGFSPGGAYKGRGASAFGALSRSVFTLEKGKLKGNQVRLSCPKVKGEKFADTVLELDPITRWFNVVDANAAQSSTEKLSGYEQVIKFVLMAQRVVKRNEVVIAFNGKNGEKPFIASSTVTKHLANAFKAGRLDNPRYGYYSAPKNIEGEIPLAE